MEKIIVSEGSELYEAIDHFTWRFLLNNEVDSWDNITRAETGAVWQQKTDWNTGLGYFEVTVSDSAKWCWIVLKWS